MVFIQYIFVIRSIRQTIKEIETNVGYSWFLGVEFYIEFPHCSTFGDAYFYFREFEEVGYLDLARCLTMTLKFYFIGFESKF